MRLDLVVEGPSESIAAALDESAARSPSTASIEARPQLVYLVRLVRPLGASADRPGVRRPPTTSGTSR